MKKEELQYEKTLSYEELVDYLLNKYGKAKYDYFHTPECKSKNRKVTRTSEGLLCHHIHENEVSYLSRADVALKSPFEYQKANSLVYCNYIEHLLLHLLIGYDSIKRWTEKILSLNPHILNPNSAYSIHYYLPSNGGIDFLIRDCNELYKNKGSKNMWQQRCYEEIQDNYDDYIDIIVEIIQKAISHYQGAKTDVNEIHIGDIFYSKDKKKWKVIEIKKCEFDFEYIAGTNHIILRHFFETKTLPKNTLNNGCFHEIVKTIIRIYSYDYNNAVIEQIYNSIASQLNSRTF